MNCREIIFDNGNRKAYCCGQHELGNVDEGDVNTRRPEGFP